MTFNTDEAKAALPAIVHYDGTARPQVVDRDAAPWLHALLMRVKELTGWAVLINTSFNTRGKPILNTVAEALALLRDSPAMNAAVVDALFVTLPQRPRVLKKRRDVGGAAQGELRR